MIIKQNKPACQYVYHLVKVRDIEKKSLPAQDLRTSTSVVLKDLWQNSWFVIQTIKGKKK